MTPSFTIAVAKGTFAGYAPGLRELDEGTVLIDLVSLGSPEEVAQNTANADAVIVGLQRLGADEIAALGAGVRAISRAGIGLDSIDLEAARQRRVAVIHQPDYATNEVATHAVALLLAVNRKLMIGDAIARRGWKGRRALGEIMALDEMSVGIVGAGAIGRAVISRLRPLVRRIIYFDPFVGSVEGATRCDTLDELLAMSDAVSLHAPVTAETHHLLDAKRIDQLRDGAILVNVARGELVDTGALLDAIKSGRLAGAGLDVFEQEPFGADHPLTEFEQVLLTPHIGFLSKPAVTRLETQTLEDVLCFLASGEVHGGRIAVLP